jgi:hypothetical protein
MHCFKSIKTEYLRIVLSILFLTVCSTISANAQNLETRQIDLKGCIRTFFGDQFIIKTRETFLKKIGSDASRNKCLKDFGKLDFGKNTLLGIELNTGYCGVPLGLKSQAVKNETEKQYVIKISYLEPRGTCRALSQYDLWLLVPKLPDDYTVKFEVKGIPGNENNQ